MRVKKKKAAKKKKGKKGKGKKMSANKSMSMTMSPIARKGSMSESPSKTMGSSIKKTATKATPGGDSAAKGKGERNPTPGSDKKVTAVDNEMSIDLTTDEGEGAFGHSTIGRRETQ